MAERPLAITIIGGLELVIGAIVLISFLVVGITSTAIAGIDFGGNLVLAIVCGLIFGGIPIVIGYGMLQGWRIMWWLGVIFNILSVFGGFMILPAGVIDIVVSGIILYYLFRPHVKSFFRV